MAPRARTPAATSGMLFADAPPVLLAASVEVADASALVVDALSSLDVVDAVASAVVLASDEELDPLDEAEVVMVESVPVEVSDPEDEESIEVESALTVPVALPARDSVGAPSVTVPVWVATVLSESMTKYGV